MMARAASAHAHDILVGGVYAGDGDAVAGVNAHRIEVLDATDDDDVVARSRMASSSNSFQPMTD